MIRLARRTAVIAASAAVLAAGCVATASVADAAAPSCTTSDIAVTRTAAQGAAGTGAFDLLYRNVTAHTCTLHGYPGVDAITTTGHVLQHASREAGSASTVTLAGNKFAHALVLWADVTNSGGACATSAAIATTIPNTTHVTHFAVPVSVCSLRVRAVASGTDHNDAFARAQEYWKSGADKAAAAQGYYWRRAQSYLTLDKSQYASVIAELHNLIGIPETDVTPAQQKAAHKDVTDLDRFFATSGLYL